MHKTYVFPILLGAITGSAILTNTIVIWQVWMALLIAFAIYVMASWANPNEQFFAKVNSTISALLTVIVFSQGVAFFESGSVDLIKILVSFCVSLALFALCIMHLWLHRNREVSIAIDVLLSGPIAKKLKEELEQEAELAVRKILENELEKRLAKPQDEKTSKNL